MSNHWKDDEKQRAAAWAAVQKKLWSRQLITATEAEHKAPWEVTFVSDLVGSSTVRMGDCASLAEYTERIGAYIDHTLPPIIGGTLSVNRGDFTLTAVVDDGATLAQQARALHRRLEVATDGLPFKAMEGQRQPGAQGATYEEHPADTLTCEYANGRHSYKVKGGPFTKWGVRIWPETLVRAGLSPDGIEMGDTELDGTMKVLVEGGRPKKVVELSL